MTKTGSAKAGSQGGKTPVQMKNIAAAVPAQVHAGLKSKLAAQGESIKDWLLRKIKEEVPQFFLEDDPLKARGALHAGIERKEQW